MNELLATLIASAFSAGGIAGIAAFINLGGKRKLHKDLERLAEVGKLSDGDQTVISSLVASRRAIATEIAAKALIKHHTGNILLILSFIVAYFSLFYVSIVVISGYPLYADQEEEVSLGWLALLVVLFAYFYIGMSIFQVRLKRRNLQALLLREEATVDEIVYVAQALQRSPTRRFGLATSLQRPTFLAETTRGYLHILGIIIRGRDPEPFLRDFRSKEERQLRLF